jgi:hypothetical protein
VHALLVSEGLKTKAQYLMGAAAGIHRDNAGRAPIQNIEQPMLLEAFAEYHRSRFIDASSKAVTRYTDDDIILKRLRGR